MGSNEKIAKSEKNGEDESPFPLTEVDKWVLSQTDEEFHLHDWEELKRIIGGDISFLLLFPLENMQLLLNKLFSCRS